MGLQRQQGDSFSTVSVSELLPHLLPNNYQGNNWGKTQGEVLSSFLGAGIVKDPLSGQRLGNKRGGMRERVLCQAGGGRPGSQGSSDKERKVTEFYRTGPSSLGAIYTLSFRGISTLRRLHDLSSLRLSAVRDAALPLQVQHQYSDSLKALPSWLGARQPAASHESLLHSAAN